MHEKTLPVHDEKFPKFFCFFFVGDTEVQNGGSHDKNQNIR